MKNFEVSCFSVSAPALRFMASFNSCSNTHDTSSYQPAIGASIKLKEVENLQQVTGCQGALQAHPTAAFRRLHTCSTAWPLATCALLS